MLGTTPPAQVAPAHQACERTNSAGPNFRSRSPGQDGEVSASPDWDYLREKVGAPLAPAVTPRREHRLRVGTTCLRTDRPVLVFFFCDRPDHPDRCRRRGPWSSPPASPRPAPEVTSRGHA